MSGTVATLAATLLELRVGEKGHILVPPTLPAQQFVVLFNILANALNPVAISGILIAIIVLSTIRTSVVIMSMFMFIAMDALPSSPFSRTMTT